MRFGGSVWKAGCWFLLFMEVERLERGNLVNTDESF
jgi:hypothetical protein